jgi:hypothetical protein
MLRNTSNFGSPTSPRSISKPLRTSLVFGIEESVVIFDEGITWIYDGENCMKSIFSLFTNTSVITRSILDSHQKKNNRSSAVNPNSPHKSNSSSFLNKSKSTTGLKISVDTSHIIMIGNLLFEISRDNKIYRSVCFARLSVLYFIFSIYQIYNIEKMLLFTI